MKSVRTVLFLLLTALVSLAKDANDYSKTIQPLLSKYCYGCHGDGKDKGDVKLDAWDSPTALLSDHAVWSRVMHVLGGHEMPPKNKPQPSPKERDLIVKWIETRVFECDCSQPDPGRVTLRRLNREEYNNTIRDLVGVDFKPAEDFPVDASGYGFDNIADALSLPPMLIEKYLAAAETILRQALYTNAPPAPETNRYPVDLLEVGYNAKQQGDGWIALNSIEEDDVAITRKTTVEGDYRIRVRAYARQDGVEPMKLTFMLDNMPAQLTEVQTNAETAGIYEATVRVPPGTHRFRAVVRRKKDGLDETDALKWKSGNQQKGAVVVQWLELEGPLNAKPVFHTEARRRLLPESPAPGREKEAASRMIGNFAKRAFRRPVKREELGRLLALATNAWKDGQSFEEGLEVAFQAILVSPHFLFQGQWPQGQGGKSASTKSRDIDEWALASRLSYFLWSSMPDDELFALAERGVLRRNLQKQVRRMLADPRAGALVKNFAGQWLQLRNLAELAPDPKIFKDFDEPLRAAMKQETEMFFDRAMREDRSILEFINADYTYANERLARHYGLTGVTGSEFRKVSLAGTSRRGVLTHGSVLTLTSNPTRTSPVKRGKWVLETLLNAPPPPPPPDVPELKEQKELTGTLRQRMEQHRADPLCASCHARMDPIGFGLENFDGIGAWRDKEGSLPIVASDALVTGETFDGPSELISILAGAKKTQFIRALTEKMLTYALGRGLEYYDKCAVDEIARLLEKRDYRFSALIEGIVRSTPFQKSRVD